MNESLAAESSVHATPGGVSIAIDALQQRFVGGPTVIDDFSLRVPAGQFIALLGPSGCGKSTLLRLVAGLDRATSGSVRLLAPPLRGRLGGGGSTQESGIATGRPHLTSPAGEGPEARPRSGYVFQDAHLLPWATALDNAALPLKLAGVSKRERREKAEAILRRVGLGDALRRYPAQLSGGMRMRVSLARALITDPALLLLDEPFAALDEITRQQLDDLVRELWLVRRPTVVFVTHSIHEATYLAERVVVLTGPPATVVLDHAVDLPATRNVQTRGSDAFVRQSRVLFDALHAAMNLL